MARKTEVTRIRLSAGEREALEEAAAIRGHTISEALRTGLSVYVQLTPMPKKTEGGAAVLETAGTPLLAIQS